MVKELEAKQAIGEQAAMHILGWECKSYYICMSRGMKRTIKTYILYYWLYDTRMEEVGTASKDFFMGNSGVCSLSYKLYKTMLGKHGPISQCYPSSKLHHPTAAHCITVECLNPLPMPLSDRNANPMQCPFQKPKTPEVSSFNANHSLPQKNANVRES